MGKVDLKTLARELKAGHNNPTSQTSAKKEDGLPVPQKEANSSGLKKFEELLKTVNNRADFNSEGCVYIDSNLYDLLRQLKVGTKLKAGYLVSWLIEQFVLEHKGEITALLKSKVNRYLVR